MIFDQSSPRKFIESLTLEIASILPSHEDFSNEIHEDPDFVLIIVHEEVVDLVEVVHLLQEHDQFLFAETL